jgi:predicted metal-dependent phosphoesterase TrpH
MKLDPHIHSSYSGDARSSPKDIIERAKSIGLDMIAISDHNTIKGSKVAIELSKNMDDFLVIPSIEISSSGGHILGLGVKSIIPKGLSPEETVEKIHDEGGIAIIPHPFSFYRNGLFFNNKETVQNLVKEDKSNKNSLIEGIEVLNARYIVGYSNYKANKLANKYNLGKIGSSDSHFLESIGNCYTEIKDINREPTIDDVIDSIISKKTIAKGSRTANHLIAKEVFNKKIRKIY